MADKVATLNTKTGLTKEAIEALSRSKNEPEWVLARRLEAWHLYEETPMPAPNDELWRRTPTKDLNLDSVIPFLTETQARDASAALPAKFQQMRDDQNSAGVLAKHNANVAYTRLADDLKKRGVIFCDIDTAIREHSDLVKEYFMTKAVTYNVNPYASA